MKWLQGKHSSRVRVLFNAPCRQFVGLVVDNASQPDRTDARVQAWVAQLLSEGFLNAVAPPAPPAAAPVAAAAPTAVAPAAPAGEDAVAVAGQASFAKPWHAGRASGFPVTFKEVIGAPAGHSIARYLNKETKRFYVGESTQPACFFLF